MVGKKGTWLLDASNLVAGGGVQVAASVITGLDRCLPEAAQRRPWLWNTHVLVSQEVANNLPPLERLSAQVASRRWRLRQIPIATQNIYDAVFTLFGPVYGPRVAHHEIEGCADVTSVNPLSSLDSGPGASNLKQLIRQRLSRASIRRSDAIVVETEDFARLVAEFANVDPAKVSVVPNSWHPAFDEPPAPEIMKRFASLFHGEEMKLLYVARAYRHKNHEFIGRLADALLAHGHRMRVVVTLEREEWESLDSRTRMASVNAGPVTIQEAPALYQLSDGVLFPSLLEASSAVPLEALRAGKPLYASDRGFVRSICGDAAVYFDPEDAHTAAAVLAEAITNKEATQVRQQYARTIVESWPTSADRVKAYLDIVDRHLGRVK